MPLDVPLRLGPFTIAADGRLSPGSAERFPSFHVRWRGHTVQARLAAHTAGGGALALRAVLGRVRSTGQPERATTATRQSAFAAMRALPTLLPAGWNAGLLPDHRVWMEAREPLPLPTSAERLVACLVLFLLRLAPYLDLFAEGAGFEPAEDAAADEDGSAGSWNTCPG
jgi:hypothetical protein